MAPVKRNIVFDKKTKFHHIKVVDNKSPNYNYRVLTFGGRFFQGLLDNENGENLYYAGNAFLLARLFRNDFSRVAFLGAGGGTGPREWMRRFRHPEMRIDVVDIDEEVFAVAEKFFDYPTSDPRLRNHAMDAQEFLKATSETYDLIVLDAYAETPMAPAHLTSPEGFRLMSQRLSPGGIFAFNLYSRPSSWIHVSYLRMIKSVFERDVTTFGLGKLTGKPDREQNLILFAHQGMVPRESLTGEAFSGFAHGKSFQDYVETQLPERNS